MKLLCLPSFGSDSLFIASRSLCLGAWCICLPHFCLTLLLLVVYGELLQDQNAQYRWAALPPQAGFEGAWEVPDESRERFLRK
ncbi:hypothetical protein VTP01DRAFT_7021 [Rhizomucor pusillus]|uniref:uncharacterized protein n=1 Tax=Rhizomucor pusillus TaxID=4840 RepID=UPI003741F4E7